MPGPSSAVLAKLSQKSVKIIALSGRLESARPDRLLKDMSEVGAVLQEC